MFRSDSIGPAALAAACIIINAPATAQEWQHTGGPPGSNIERLAAGGGFAYGSTPGGLARFNPQTAAWQVLPTSQWIPPARDPAVFDIAVTPEAVLVSTDTGALIRSLDDGQTWEALPGHGPQTSLLADGSRLYAHGSAGLQRSDDQGATWQSVNFPGGGGFHASGNILLAGGFDTYFVSLDGGQTYQTRPIPPAGFAVPVAFASTSHGFYMAINSLTSSSARIYRSTDQGASFQQIATTGDVLSRVVDGDTVYLLTEEQTFFTNRLWKIANGTLTETGIVPPGFQSSRHLPMTHLAGDLLVGTPDVGALRSTDGGQTWGTVNDGLGFTLVSNMAAGSGVALAGVGGDDRLWRFQSGQWSPSTPLAGGNILSIHHLGGSAFIAGTDRTGIFLSSDQGATWTPSSAGLPQYNGSAGLQFREVEDLAHNGSAIFAALGFGTEMINGQFRLSGGGLARSTDGGATWQRINTGLPIQMTNNFGQPVFDPFISVETIGSVVLAGSGSTGLWRSTNNGASWQPVSSITSSIADLQTLNNLIYAAATEGVFVSADQGQTWSDTAFPGIPRALGVAGGQLFAAAFPVNGGGGGIYRLEESIWQRTDSDFSDVIIYSLAGQGDTLYAGTGHLGVWRFGGECYPNCDGSSVQPTLNVADFTCFLHRFAAGDPYANCDNSTTPPTLNVADFTCFLQTFAAGCP